MVGSLGTSGFTCYGMEVWNGSVKRERKSEQPRAGQKFTGRFFQGVHLQSFTLIGGVLGKNTNQPVTAPPQG